MPCPMHPVNPLSPDIAVSLVMYSPDGKDIVTKHLDQNDNPDTTGMDEDKRSKPPKHSGIGELGKGTEYAPYDKSWASEEEPVEVIYMCGVKEWRGGPDD